MPGAIGTTMTAAGRSLVTRMIVVLLRCVHRFSSQQRKLRKAGALRFRPQDNSRGKRTTLRFNSDYHAMCCGNQNGRHIACARQYGASGIGRRAGTSDRLTSVRPLASSCEPGGPLRTDSYFSVGPVFFFFFFLAGANSRTALPGLETRMNMVAASPFDVP